MMPGFTPIPSGSLGPSVSFGTNKSRTSASSVYTFSDCDIGVADTTRVVVIGISQYRYDTSAALSSVTIGGSSATVIAKGARQIAGGSGSFIYSSIAYRAIPTGTTADVVVSLGNNANVCAIGVWSIYDVKNSSPILYKTAEGPTSASLDENVIVGDVGIAISTSGYGTLTRWTGATERFDILPDSVYQIGVSGADLSATVSASPRTITATQSGGLQIVGSVAIWR